MTELCKNLKQLFLITENNSELTYSSTIALRKLDPPD